MCQAPKERQVPGGIKNIKASPGAVKKELQMLSIPSGHLLDLVSHLASL